jgi:hypothetical protein
MKTFRKEGSVQVRRVNPERELNRKVKKSDGFRPDYLSAKRERKSTVKKAIGSLSPKLRGNRNARVLAVRAALSA